MQLTKEILYNQDNRALLSRLINSMPGLCAIKNLQNQYLLCNDAMANLGGFESGEQIVSDDIRDHQLRGKVSKSAQVFRQQDTHIFKHKAAATIITNDCYAGEKWLLSLGKKFTLMGDDNIAYGIGFHVQDITSNPLINLAKYISLQDTPYGTHHEPQFTYIVTEGISCFDLSARQAECLFFFLRGKSANDIATILKINRRTVETHLENIKDKFTCKNKSQLIEKAIDAGMLNYLPQRLLHAINNTKEDVFS